MTSHEVSDAGVYWNRIDPTAGQREGVQHDDHHSTDEQQKGGNSWGST